MKKILHYLMMHPNLGVSFNGRYHNYVTALREQSSQTNVILQYKLLAVCSVIQQS